MSARSHVVIVYLIAIISAVAAAIAAIRMLVIANADQPVPGFLTSLLVLFLLLTVALLGSAAALQRRHSARTRPDAR